MAFKALAAILALTLLSACSQRTVEAPVIYDPNSPLIVERVEVSREAAPEYYRIKSGDTLFSIAFRYGMDVDELAKRNGIRTPFVIYPKQIIRVMPYPKLGKGRRDSEIVQSTKKAASDKNPDTPNQLVDKPPAVKKTPKKPSNSEIEGSKRPKSGQVRPEYVGAYKIDAPAIGQKKSVTKWVWPVKGIIIKGFSKRKQGGKGLDIAGQRGTPIRAAADGKVVYRGQGLRGYGKLIIIKHSDTLLSAYAHNDKILVEDNEIVKAGQHIAEMGDTGTNKTMLHFEIRRKGRPVDPLIYLPNL